MDKNQEKDILKIIQEMQIASVDILAKKLFISPATVRRRLNDLQKKGLVVRVHGGAKINDSNNFYPSFTLRVHQNSSEKKKIALAAIKLIKNGDLVFIDGSTTAFFIAEYLSEFKDLMVMTNGIDTLSLLSKNNINAYSTGGAISTTNRSALVGQIAQNTVNTMHADIAFFSAHSINKDGEIYDIFEQENHLRKCMMKNATKKVLLCDSTKLDKFSPFRLCSMDDIDYMVCNYDITEYFDKDYSNKIITF